MNINQFPYEVYPALREIIFEQQKVYTPQYPKIMNVLDSERYYEEEATEIGAGLYVETADGEDYHEDTNYPGYYTKYQNKKYTNYLRISEDMVKFEMYTAMGKRSRDFSNKGRVTRDILAHLIYNNGFTTNLSDGVPLFSLNHPGSPSLNASLPNVLTTQANLSYVALNSVLTNLAMQTDARGVLVNMTPRKLVCHPSNRLTALECLRSYGRPDTANRADNELKKMAEGIELIIDPYLNSPSMWFIICDEYNVKAFEPGGFTLRTRQDPFSWDYLIFGSFYMSVGCSDFLGVYAGSQ